MTATFIHVQAVEEGLNIGSVDKRRTNERTSGKTVCCWELFHNRWWCLVIYVLALFGATLLYGGWQPWALLLYNTGAYLWLCPEGTIQAVESFSCVEQENAVKSLFTFATSTEYVTAFVSGWILDIGGPRLCGLLGEIAFFAGNMMVWYSSQNMPMYIPGHVLAGISGNLALVPAFVAADMFSSRPALLIAVAIAAQCAGAMVSDFVWELHSAFKFNIVYLWSCYLLCFALPLAILYIPSLPRKRAHFVAQESVTDIGGRTTSAELLRFLRIFCAVEPLSFVAWYVLMLMQHNAYSTSVIGFAGVDVAEYLGWMMPTQALWGVALGWLNDRVGTLPVCVILTAMNLVFFLTALFRGVAWLQYIGATIFLISNSYIYTTKYTFSAEYFMVEDFGKIAGSVSLLAGPIQMINILISENVTSYDTLFGAWAGVTTFLFLLLGVIIFRYGRKQPQLDNAGMEDLDQENGSVENDSVTRSPVEKADLIHRRLTPLKISQSTVEE